MLTRIGVLLLTIWAATLHGQKFLDTTFQVTQETLFFDSNQSLLSDSDSKVLQSIVKLSQNLDSSYIIIRAHTDAVGSEKSNFDLSRDRAASVYNHLTSLGYDTSSVYMEFLGETEPRSPNNSDLGKADNRRVDITLFAKQRLTWISGRVMEDSLATPITAQVFLYTDHFKDSTLSDSAGNYQINAPIKQDVILEVRSSEHLPHFISLPVMPQITSKPVDLRPPSIRQGAKFQLLTLNFFGDQSLPLPGARRTLNTVGKFLRNHLGVCIEIQGHVNAPDQDRVSTKSQSYFLSVARAKVVYDYLELFYKIGPDRMYYQGYANWKMLFPHAKSARHQRLNRRVEIHICPCEKSRTTPNAKTSSNFSFYELLGRKNLFH